MLHEVCILIDIEKNTRCDILTWIFKVVLSWLETTTVCYTDKKRTANIQELNYSPCVTGSYLPPLIKQLDVCCSSPCPNYWIASEKMYTDRSSEHSCHFFEGKSAYVTEVIWNAVGPFPIQPCSWPPSVSCKAQAGEFKKKKKKKDRHTTHTVVIYYYYFF